MCYFLLLVLFSVLVFSLSFIFCIIYSAALCSDSLFPQVCCFCRPLVPPLPLPLSISYFLCLYTFEALSGACRMHFPSIAPQCCVGHILPRTRTRKREIRCLGVRVHGPFTTGPLLFTSLSWLSLMRANSKLFHEWFLVGNAPVGTPPAARSVPG